MSGLEVIGAVASISQLCSYIIDFVARVKETAEAIKDLPKELRGRIRYLDTLSTILRVIEQDLSLQSSEISPQLQDIAAKIKSLQALLTQSLDRFRGKQWKIFAHITLDRGSTRDATDRALTALEQDKSNLLLYLVSNFGQKFNRALEMAGHTSTYNAAAGNSTSSASNQLVRTSGTSLSHTESGSSSVRDSAGSNLNSQDDRWNDSAKSWTQAPSWADKRSWNEIEIENTQGAVLGDRNRPAEELSQASGTSRLDERGWSRIRVGGQNGMLTFGDEYSK